ncbi:MAG: hypothetical protein JJ939_13390 [Alphaproteobacteria bacterium]|nr:hypothetical protein [Rhodobiaceae bacterium]MBO6542578.1 hypothetical protein [Alphaproteobacteria bacterium]MBO6629408.1 hypothetical protein [Alphaproteobacteria bacterium]MDF1626012.1 hypothetical protein [Parvibaculaceae bacterium]
MTVHDHRLVLPENKIAEIPFKAAQNLRQEPKNHTKIAPFHGKKPPKQPIGLQMAGKTHILHMLRLNKSKDARRRNGDKA